MIGILGGTFDPVHFGHLRTAVEAREALGLDQIRLIPCREPPHRGLPAAPVAMRVEMLELAVADEPGLCVDRREIDRPGPSYTVDTLRSIREEYPDQTLALILGMDAFVKLDAWHSWQDLPKLTHFIVAHRPGYIPRRLDFLSPEKGFHERRQVRDLARYQSGAVVFLPLRQLAIASTEIREMIHRQQNPRFLLPDAVLALIRARRLYR